MVGAHPSMPDTLDGNKTLAQAEIRGIPRPTNLEFKSGDIESEYMRIPSIRIPSAALTLYLFVNINIFYIQIGGIRNLFLLIRGPLHSYKRSLRVYSKRCTRQPCNITVMCMDRLTSAQKVEQD